MFTHTTDKRRDPLQMENLVSMLIQVDMVWILDTIFRDGSLFFHMIMYVSIPNYIDHLLHWSILTNHHMIVRNFTRINQH